MITQEFSPIPKYPPTVWEWPVSGYLEISSGVGPRWGTDHNGIDIPAPIDTPVVAAREGQVIDTYTSCTHNYGKSNATDPENCGGGYGNRIYIDHGDGYISRYAHLTSVRVRKGDRVSAGQVIGSVGTTGDSTGPHLHFEIRLNGEVKDPEIYLSGSSSSSSPSSSPSIVVTDDSAPTSNLVIVGERVSNISTQPMHAYVQIYLGDNPLSDKPQYMQNFEITRFTGAGDTARFTIFDDSWSMIERDFSNHWDNVKLKYGYVGGVSSELYNMQLTDYSLNFNSTGTFLSVEAVSHGVVENLKPVELRIDTKNPTEAVKQICKQMGWTVISGNFEYAVDAPADVNFSIDNKLPVTHILENILPYSKSSDGELFDFYLDSENVAYFKSEGFRTELNDRNLRTYIFQKGYDSPIISLTFNINGVFGGTSSAGVASGTRTSVFDLDTKEEISYAEDIKSVVTSATGEVISMKANQSIPNVDSAGYSTSLAKSRMYYDVKKDMTSHYTAEMTIVGDPTIKLLDNIRIINVTDDGYLHHTSGVYMIKGITDYVSDGSMTTSLSLVRNGSGLIEDGQGVEIISPKILVK